MKTLGVSLPTFLDPNAYRVLSSPVLVWLNLQDLCCTEHQRTSFEVL